MIDTISRLLYHYFPYIGMLVMIIVFFKDRGQLKIHWDGISKFVGFSVLLMFLKLAVMDGEIDTSPNYKLGLGNFLTVFLEDAFFVMIPYYLNKLINKKSARGVVWIIFSIAFGMGHMYQGLFAGGILTLCPYFVSYKYAMKTSFATVMACHFMWDCFVTITPKIHKILQILQHV